MHQFCSRRFAGPHRSFFGFLLLSAAVVVALLSGCAGPPAEPELPEASFRFRHANGATSVVRVIESTDAAEIGLSEGRRALRFTVEGGIPALGATEALHLVMGDGSDHLEFGTTDAEGTPTVQRALASGVAGVTLIEVPSAEEGAAGFFVAYAGDTPPRVVAASIGSRSARISHHDGVTHLGADVTVIDQDRPHGRRLAVEIPQSFITTLTNEPWTVAVRFDPIEAETPPARYTPGTARFTSADGSHRRSMQLVLTPGNRNLFFPEGILGFVPGRVEVEVEAGMRIASVELQRNGLVGLDTKYPAIPADLGVIHGFDPARWRNPRFELFKWNVPDNVLIFDFADFAIQRAMFGRLGFFVAVVGEAGQIFPEEHYEGRHAYNAHDYRPEDLVRFFNTAEQTGIALNEWEEFLRDLLVDYDMIRPTPLGFTEGEGAVLSYARQIWGPLRARLLRHEAAHGVFYVSPEFRDGAFALWEEMSELEQDYWRLFLGNKGRMDGREGYDGYDVERHYLLVNEMQAHVLQLNPQEVNPYFRDFYARRIREVVPEASPIVERLLEAEPDVFVNTRRRLEELFELGTGIRGGRMMGVIPGQIEEVQ